MGRPKYKYDKELSALFTRMWDDEESFCEHGEDFKLNIHNKFGRNKRLFKYFNEDVLNIPTYAAFCKLLHNYEDFPEVKTETEIRQEHTFLWKILKTKVMKEAHKYLVRKGKSLRNIYKFKNQLYDIWFELYERNNGGGYYCGFEHIFVGEIRGNEVFGFHNWISLYLQEKFGNLKYYSCYCYHRSCPAGKYPDLLTFRFSWNGALKEKGSSFIGTSPELEIAMYTVAFLCIEDSDIYVKINGHPILLNIYDHGDGIGTAYPECLEC